MYTVYEYYVNMYVGMKYNWYVNSRNPELEVTFFHFNYKAFELSMGEKVL